MHIAAPRSSAICNGYSTCASALRTRVVSTRGVPSWICGSSSCRHLLGFVQLLPVSFHSVLRVLVYLSRLLIVAVANELATLRCVSLAVSASQGRKVTWDGSRSRYCSSSFPPCRCYNWLCFAGSCLRPHPRTAVIRVRTSMLSSLHQRPTQSWNSVFSRFCTSSRCSATQSCLLDVSVRQCFLVFKLFSCEDQSLLFSTSKLHHFLHTRIRGNHNDLVNNHPLLDHKSD